MGSSKNGFGRVGRAFAGRQAAQGGPPSADVRYT
jgi:hypothetical protein